MTNLNLNLQIPLGTNKFAIKLKQKNTFVLNYSSFKSLKLTLR